LGDNMTETQEAPMTRKKPDARPVGRPRKGEEAASVQVHLRLEPADVERLDEIRALTGEDRAAFIRRHLKYVLTRYAKGVERVEAAADAAELDPAGLDPYGGPKLKLRKPAGQGKKGGRRG
jgi:Ribbon-helix-helix protein, copG family